jgi:hypothetical protein
MNQRSSAPPATTSWTPVSMPSSGGAVKLAKVAVQFSGWWIA